MACFSTSYFSFYGRHCHIFVSLCRSGHRYSVDSRHTERILRQVNFKICVWNNFPSDHSLYHSFHVTLQEKDQTHGIVLGMVN